MNTGSQEALSACSPPYYVRALALGIPAILLGIEIMGWLFFIPVIRDGHFDFRQLYTAGYMVRTGHRHQLYDYAVQKSFQDALFSREQIALPFNHFAYEALLYMPLSFFSYRSAYFVSLALNLLLLAICFRALRPHMSNLADVWRGLPLAMFLTFIPITAALMQGQDSILLLTLLAGAMIALEEGREFTAGLLVGFGLFKFQITIPIAAFFLLRKKLRFSQGFFVSTAAVILVSVWLVGPSELMEYARSLLSMSVRLGSAADQFRYGISPAAMPNLRGMIFGIADGHMSSVAIQAITIAASAALLLLVSGSCAKNQTGRDILIIAITAAVLASYHLLIHDLSVLLIPVVVILNRFIGAEATGGAEGKKLARTAALVFAAPMCMSFVPAHFYIVSLAVVALLIVLLRYMRSTSRVQDTSPVPLAVLTQ